METTTEGASERWQHGSCGARWPLRNLDRFLHQLGHVTDAARRYQDIPDWADRKQYLELATDDLD